jgi:hypothetical protein
MTEEGRYGMDTSAATEPTEQPTRLPDCVELGEWTKIPVPPHQAFRLRFKDIDPARHRAIRKTKVLTFHAVGCTGCHANQQTTTHVAQVMAAHVDHPHRFGGVRAAERAAFLYHLGDVVYKHDKDTVGEQSVLSPADQQKDFGLLYNAQFYAPYAEYAPPIFAIAGNHDGKDKVPDGPARKSAIHHFLKNFCGLSDGEPPDNQSSERRPGRQPYPYWVLQTPVAFIVGLYTNVNNAGQLDNPQDDARPQFDWLVRTLKKLRRARSDKAVLVALHYPPYSAAVNFLQRGNPNLGPTPRPAGKQLQPLGMLLQEAFRASGQYPDAVLSAHAHLYQRLLHTHGDGRQIPYLIAGAGGHAPVEKLSKPCAKDQEAANSPTHPEVVHPDGLTLPAPDRVELAAYNDTDFGFLRITVDGKKHTLTGEYFTVASQPGAVPSLFDSFTLDLKTHKLR